MDVDSVEPSTSSTPVENDDQFDRSSEQVSDSKEIEDEGEAVEPVEQADVSMEFDQQDELYEDGSEDDDFDLDEFNEELEAASTLQELSVHDSRNIRPTEQEDGQLPIDYEYPALLNPHPLTFDAVNNPQNLGSYAASQDHAIAVNDPYIGPYARLTPLPNQAHAIPTGRGYTRLYTTYGRFGQAHAAPQDGVLAGPYGVTPTQAHAAAGRPYIDPYAVYGGPPIETSQAQGYPSTTGLAYAGSYPSYAGQHAYVQGSPGTAYTGPYTFNQGAVGGAYAGRYPSSNRNPSHTHGFARSAFMYALQPEQAQDVAVVGSANTGPHPPTGNLPHQAEDGSVDRNHAGQLDGTQASAPVRGTENDATTPAEAPIVSRTAMLRDYFDIYPVTEYEVMLEAYHQKYSRDVQPYYAPEGDRPLLCVCMKTDDGSSYLRCDNGDRCMKTFYHAECLGFTEATIPKGGEEWYCPDCIRRDLGKARARTERLARRSAMLERPLKIVPRARSQGVLGLDVPAWVEPSAGPFPEVVLQHPGSFQDLSVHTVDAAKASLRALAARPPGQAAPLPAPIPAPFRVPVMGTVVTTPNKNSWTDEEDGILIECMTELIEARNLSGNPVWEGLEPLLKVRLSHRCIGGARNRWMRGLREETNLDERRKKNATKMTTAVQVPKSQRNPNSARSQTGRYGMSRKANDPAGTLASPGPARRSAVVTPKREASRAPAPVPGGPSSFRTPARTPAPVATPGSPVRVRQIQVVPSVPVSARSTRSTASTIVLPGNEVAGVGLRRSSRRRQANDDDETAAGE